MDLRNREIMEMKDIVWVVEVESELLKSEESSDEWCDDLIHTVPKSLLSKNTEVFYLPQVISLGPYNFQMKDSLENEMESLKTEVARKMHLKIMNNGGLISVIQKFTEREKQRKLKESYANNFELSSEACAWMIVRDACFVLEVLDRFGKDDQEEKSVKAFKDSALSRKRHHHLLPEIVKDVLKMENQLPFWALEEIRSDIMGPNDGVWFESALKILSPIKVADRRNWECKRSHILQLLYDFIVNKQTERPHQVGYFHTIFTKTANFRVVAQSLCSLRSLKYAIVLLLLFPIIVLLFILGIIFFTLCYVTKNVFVILNFFWYPISPEGEEKRGEEIPTAGELKRFYFKFKKLRGDKTGISHIKFMESQSTLYLPEFRVDDRSEVILRNLIALEMFSREEEKPIKRYVILMNDLIKTTRDVSVLRREGIISGRVGSDKEIVRLWNCLVTSTEMPRYEPIDSAARSINRFCGNWSKRPWTQFMELLIEFVTVHCSKPWVFLSLLAGILLLLLTLVQVICLFKTCQLK